jgi:hypothetical protein
MVARALKYIYLDQDAWAGVGQGGVHKRAERKRGESPACTCGGTV